SLLLLFCFSFASLSSLLLLFPLPYIIASFSSTSPANKSCQLLDACRRSLATFKSEARSRPASSSNATANSPHRDHRELLGIATLRKPETKPSALVRDR